MGRKEPIRIDELVPTWDANRPSIYEHIRSNFDAETLMLREDATDLPNTEIVFAGSNIRFAPGIDGAFSHPMPEEDVGFTPSSSV